MATVYFEVDDSDVQEELQRIRNAMESEQFNRVLYRVFNRVDGHVRKILKSELPKDYEIKAGEVGSAVGTARMVSSGGIGVGCTIPIRGARRSIGPNGFKTRNGAYGWNSVHKKYRINAKIYKGTKSTLPATMSSYGGYPPFRNLSAIKAGFSKNTFTRTSKKRFPVRKVVGIAIPQMPMNKSQPEVQKDIAAYIMKRVEHEVQNTLKG